MLRLEDTIVAVASPPGGAAEGIVRISGPAVAACLDGRFHAAEAIAAAPGRARCTQGEFRAEGLASSIPCRLYLWPDRRSYTGQPAAELHAPGSPPLLDAIVRSLCLAGARLAEAGEFTLRAFLSGRVDLTQAEAVLGVIEAASPAALHAALRQLAGGLAEPLRAARARLLDLLADLEAGLDFTDEDIRFISSDELQTRLVETRAALEAVAETLSRRGESETLSRVVLAGRPNVGKSSLFNRLSGRGAIVSPLAGTTRDYLSAEIEVNQARFLLIDTAGMSGGREGDDAAEGNVGWAERSEPHRESPGITESSHTKLAVGRQAEMAAQKQADAAAVRILCLDATRPLDPWEADALSQTDNGRIVVLTKTDAVEADRLCVLQSDRLLRQAIAVSSHTGAGIERLLAAVGQRMAEGDGATDCVGATAIRCRESVRLAIEALGDAQQLARDEAGEELVAAELRLALQELGRVVGAVYTDDVLDRVFSRFCVGK